jgi:hypothetical protein
MKARTLLSALASLAIAASTAAQAGSLVDISVVDRDTGTTLPQYPRRGQYYVAGTPGHRYAVRIVNRSAQRVLAVLSVDGVNAISGQTANPNQSGYVLGPYESTEVAGWRKDMSEIAAFEFTELSDSYAARTGRPDNVGVIGVAVFRERYVPPPRPIYRDRIADDKLGAARESEGRRAEAPVASTAQAAPRGGAADAAKRAPAPAVEESLGTGHGQRESSYASYTTFERESSRPNEVVSVWYDSWRNLAARGIVPRHPRPVPDEPQAFPAGFVADPPRR